MHCAATATWLPTHNLTPLMESICFLSTRKENKQTNKHIQGVPLIKPALFLFIYLYLITQEGRVEASGEHGVTHQPLCRLLLCWWATERG